METDEVHRPSDGDEEDNNNRVCPCGSAENQFSKRKIYCGSCETWFHSACALISDADVEEILKKKEQWFCDFIECQGKKLIISENQE